MAQSKGYVQEILEGIRRLTADASDRGFELRSLERAVGVLDDRLREIYQHINDLEDQVRRMEILMTKQQPGTNPVFTEIARLLSHVEIGPSAPAVKPALVDVWALDFDPTRKIPAIKAVRQVTGLGLKEAKHFVETLPRTLRANVTMEAAIEAERLAKAEGITVERRAAQ